MKKFFGKTIVICSLLLFITNSNAQKSTDSINIYLLTASPGEETYASFGHSAIRVNIPSRNYDYVFNYGIFDFSTPNFYFKFTTGRLLYSLGYIDYYRFINSYNSWGQAIFEQKLLLSQKESIRLLQLLEENYKTENRYYRYSFFYDNCATRIRDIIEKSVDGKIIYDSTYITKSESFRQLYSQFLTHNPWMLFGTKLLLGAETDKTAQLTDYMFLPEHLMKLYSLSVIKTADNSRHLAAAPVELFPSTLVFFMPNRLLTPEIIMGILFLVVLTLSIFEKKYKWDLTWMDRFLFIICGLLGILMSFLAIWSLHREVAQNYNILWANPVTLIIGVFLFSKVIPKWIAYLLLLYTISIAVFIPISFLLRQVIPLAAYLLIGMLLIRSWVLWQKTKKYRKITL